MCLYVYVVHVHIIGVPRKLSVLFCPCESDAEKLVKLRYWPATPKRPSIAFSFSLLDWLEALLLECQVALNDASKAIALLVTEKIKQVCVAYNQWSYGP